MEEVKEEVIYGPTTFVGKYKLPAGFEWMDAGVKLALRKSDSTLFFVSREVDVSRKWSSDCPELMPYAMAPRMRYVLTEVSGSS